MNSSMRAADLLMAAVSALALSSGVNAAGALPAPASPDPATPKNEDILVTAQKRQQTIEMRRTATPPSLPTRLRRASMR